MTNQEAILKSAELRGKYKFREAIDHITQALPTICADLQYNAYHEMFLTAQEGGFSAEALQYARKILELEPGSPTAKNYVAMHGSAT